MPNSVHVPKILASVELGNPAAHCAHFGICSIAVLSLKQWAVFKPRHIRHAKVILSVATTGCLRMEFPLEGMRADTRAEFFPKEGFRVDSGTILPKSITSLINLPMGTRTVSGVYGLSLGVDRVIVELSTAVTERALESAA